MNKGSSSQFDLPPEMREMAKASVEEARKAFESFVNAAQRAAGAMGEPSRMADGGIKDISAKAITFAEQNVAASLNYAEQVIKANDITEVMRLHTEYVQGQMRALAQQAGEMGQIITRAMIEAGKSK